jgi:predicted ATPase
VARQGRHEEGIAELEQGVSTALAGGARASMSLFFTLLADAHAQRGARDRALGVVDDVLGGGAMEEIDATDLHRLRAELLAGGGDLARGEAILRRTVDLARRQGSRAFELRAMTSLARLLVAKGEPRSAHDLLAPVYAAFDEGFDTRDLREAGALIDRLQDMSIGTRTSRAPLRDSSARRQCVS